MLAAFREPFVNSPSNDGVGGGCHCVGMLSKCRLTKVRTSFSHDPFVVNQKEFLVNIGKRLQST